MSRSGSAAPDRVCVGAVAGAFGVRGEVRLKPFTATPEAIGDYGPLWSEDGARQFQVRVTRTVKNGVAARLSGVIDRETAERLRGTRLYADRAALPPTEEDEFYHADLLGLAVVGLDGAPLGRVAAVQNYGAGDFLEIAVPGRKAPALMPFTRETVPHIDIAGGEIVSDPPLGVFEDLDESEAPSASEQKLRD